MSRPVFHQTDIFHPHADPDDHWDLACNYALAKRGDIELQGIMIDYPPWAGDPALAAVVQKLSAQLLEHMRNIGDPALQRFAQPSVPSAK